MSDHLLTGSPAQPEPQWTRSIGDSVGDDFDELATLRGQFIQEFAILEHCLCRLMADIGQMSIQSAGIIFYKITSANVRDSVLEELLKSYYGDTYISFWRSVSRMIAVVSHQRNSIVHWIAARATFDDGTTEIHLVKPNVFARKPGPHLTAQELIVFISRCKLLCHICWQFMIFVSPAMFAHWNEPMRKTWHEVYLQPLPDPLPDTHRLSPNYKEAASHPFPSTESSEPRAYEPKESKKGATCFEKGQLTRTTPLLT